MIDFYKTFFNLIVLVKNCKEKWRNLRTVFVRKLKPTSGRKYSKVYYMTEHMQFILPYIKGVKSVDIPDNVPSSPSVQDDDESSDVDEKPLLSNDSTAISSVEYFENSCPDEQVLYSSKSKKIKQNHAISLANQCYIDYTKSKKQNSQIEDPQREDYRKQFLLSMLPEVNQMTNNQMRKFKRKMLDAIDDILGETSSS